MNLQDLYMLWKSNYGRDFGWEVIYKGKVIGELTDVKSVEQFWDSYNFKPYVESVYDISVWYSDEGLEFENKKFRNQKKQAIISLDDPEGLQKGNVVVRGL